MAKLLTHQILERKGPHKSMHCQFCKEEGFGVSERQSQSHLEKRTKIRLVSQAADLQVYDVTSEVKFLKFSNLKKKKLINK